uniref:Uncharacterized protein n=1 Tax=Chrysotila carterae TaxID=13221 RepID=A0A7S4F4M0_CHRCT
MMIVVEAICVGVVVERRLLGAVVGAARVCVVVIERLRWNVAVEQAARAELRNWRVELRSASLRAGDERAAASGHAAPRHLVVVEEARQLEQVGDALAQMVLIRRLVHIVSELDRDGRRRCRVV